MALLWVSFTSQWHDWLYNVTNQVLYNDQFENALNETVTWNFASSLGPNPRSKN